MTEPPFPLAEPGPEPEPDLGRLVDADLDPQLVAKPTSQPKGKASLQQRRETVMQLRMAGLSQRDIAKRLGVSPSTVGRDLVRQAQIGGLSNPHRALVYQRITLDELMRLLAKLRRQAMPGQAPESDPLEPKAVDRMLRVIAQIIKLSGADRGSWSDASAAARRRPSTQQIQRRAQACLLRIIEDDTQSGPDRIRAAQTLFQAYGFPLAFDEPENPAPETQTQ